MTPVQLARINLVKLAAEELRQAKKEARIQAKKEARELFEKRYSELKTMATQKYYSTLCKSVANSTEEFMTLNKLELDDDDDDTDGILPE